MTCHLGSINPSGKLASDCCERERLRQCGRTGETVLRKLREPPCWPHHLVRTKSVRKLGELSPLHRPRRFHWSRENHSGDDKPCIVDTSSGTLTLNGWLPFSAQPADAAASLQANFVAITRVLVIYSRITN